MYFIYIEHSLLRFHGILLGLTDASTSRSTSTSNSNSNSTSTSTCNSSVILLLPDGRKLPHGCGGGGDLVAVVEAAPAHARQFQVQGRGGGGVVPVAVGEGRLLLLLAADRPLDVQDGAGELGQLAQAGLPRQHLGRPQGWIIRSSPGSTDPRVVEQRPGEKTERSTLEIVGFFFVFIS